MPPRQQPALPQDVLQQLAMSLTSVWAAAGALETHAF